MLKTLDTIILYGGFGFSIGAVLLLFHLQSEIHRLRKRLTELEIRKEIERLWENEKRIRHYHESE